MAESLRSAREVEEEDLIGALRQLHEDDPEGGYRVLPMICTTSATRSVNGACGDDINPRTQPNLQQTPTTKVAG